MMYLTTDFENWRTSFTERSILAPIEVKAKRQLYCLMFRINLLDIGPPLKVASVGRGSG